MALQPLQPPPPAPRAEPASRTHPASWGTWAAIATLALVYGAFAANNFAPYFGLSAAGTMTMYSGMSETFDNHLFMPTIPLGDSGTYAAITRLNVGGLGTSPARHFQDFVSRTNREHRLVNLNFVRYHASRICQSAPNASLQLALQLETGTRLEFDNVCSEPTMLRYTLWNKYPECKPRCWRVLEDWARGRLRGAGA